MNAIRLIHIHVKMEGMRYRGVIKRRKKGINL
jgi:hypothetical protein